MSLRRRFCVQKYAMFWQQIPTHLQITIQTFVRHQQRIQVHFCEILRRFSSHSYSFATRFCMFLRYNWFWCLCTINCFLFWRKHVTVADMPWADIEYYGEPDFLEAICCDDLCKKFKYFCEQISWKSIRCFLRIQKQFLS